MSPAMAKRSCQPARCLKLALLNALWLLGSGITEGIAYTPGLSPSALGSPEHKQRIQEASDEIASHLKDSRLLSTNAELRRALEEGFQSCSASFKGVDVVFKRTLHLRRAQLLLKKATSIIVDELDFDRNPIDSQAKYYQVEGRVEDLQRNIQSAGRELRQASEVLLEYSTLEETCVTSLQGAIAGFREVAEKRKRDQQRSENCRRLGWGSAMVCAASLAWLCFAPTPARASTGAVVTYESLPMAMLGKLGAATSASVAALTAVSAVRGFAGSRHLLQRSSEGTNMVVRTEAVSRLIADTSSCIADARRESAVVNSCEEHLNPVREMLVGRKFAAMKTYLNMIDEILTNSEFD